MQYNLDELLQIVLINYVSHTILIFSSIKFRPFLVLLDRQCQQIQTFELKISFKIQFDFDLYKDTSCKTNSQTFQF